MEDKGSEKDLGNRIDQEKEITKSASKPSEKSINVAKEFIEKIKEKQPQTYSQVFENNNTSDITTAIEEIGKKDTIQYKGLINKLLAGVETSVNYLLGNEQAKTYSGKEIQKKRNILEQTNETIKQEIKNIKGYINQQEKLRSKVTEYKNNETEKVENKKKEREELEELIIGLEYYIENENITDENILLESENKKNQLEDMDYEIEGIKTNLESYNIEYKEIQNYIRDEKKQKDALERFKKLNDITIPKLNIEEEKEKKTPTLEVLAKSKKAEYESNYELYNKTKLDNERKKIFQNANNVIPSRKRQREARIDIRKNMNYD
ncbi:MAG: hypothetical protein ACQESC_02290 [Nanobdellota archaeon]